MLFYEREYNVPKAKRSEYVLFGGRPPMTKEKEGKSAAAAAAAAAAGAAAAVSGEGGDRESEKERRACFSNPLTIAGFDSHHRPRPRRRRQAKAGYAREAAGTFFRVVRW